MANMIVGIKTNDNLLYFDKKFEETIQLAKALDLEIDYQMTQNLDIPNQLSYIGKGKVDELKEFVDYPNTYLGRLSELLEEESNGKIGLNDNTRRYIANYITVLTK